MTKALHDRDPRSRLLPARGRSRTDDIALRLPTPDRFEVRSRPDTHGVVLTLVGELDLASVPELELALWRIEATNPGRILIDLRCLGFMDCAGMSVIIRAQQSADTHGHRLVLRPGPHQVQRLFALTGWIDRFVFEA
jgi:anti-anti-sigma factor